MPKLIAGVDDAGRGPIIGPMVIAGVLIAEDRERELIAMGVKDSKLLTPDVRTNLAEKVRGLAAKVSAVEVEPKEIDEAVLHGGKFRKLNFLEAKLMAQVISELAPEQAYVDASDVDEERYAGVIRDSLPSQLKGISLVSKHHADRTYPVVSAASIIAKVRRDEAIHALHGEYGNFGSGYITDPRTMEFLREWRRTHGNYPPIVRLSWKTIKEIERDHGQSRLGA